MLFPFLRQNGFDTITVENTDGNFDVEFIEKLSNKKDLSLLILGVGQDNRGCKF